MSTLDYSKREIRAVLWDVSYLGGTLRSSDDDHLDDSDIGLDSLSMVWVVTQLERRTGLPVSQEVSASALQSVNTIYHHLLRCGLSDDRRRLGGAKSVAREDPGE